MQRYGKGGGIDWNLNDEAEKVEVEKKENDKEVNAVSAEKTADSAEDNTEPKSGVEDRSESDAPPNPEEQVVAKDSDAAATASKETDTAPPATPEKSL